MFGYKDPVFSRRGQCKGHWLANIIENNYVNQKYLAILRLCSFWDGENVTPSKVVNVTSTPMFGDQKALCKNHLVEVGCSGLLQFKIRKYILNG